VRGAPVSLHGVLASIREGAPVNIVLWWLLVPLMWIWDAIDERELTGVPRPLDEPRVHSAGTDCDRILLFGRGPARGWGVLSHQIALSGSLARALTDRTGRGVDVTVVAAPTITVRSAIRRLAVVRLERYDAIIITFGAKDATALAPLGRWARRMEAVLCFLDGRRLGSARIFVLGIPPVRSMKAFDSPLGAVADRHAFALNAATVRICQALPQTVFVPLTAPPGAEAGRYRTAADYGHWGKLLAERMSGSLDLGRDDSSPAAPMTEREAAVVESDRKVAVEGLNILDTVPEAYFEGVVELVRNLFATTGAAFALVDGDRYWIKTLVGGSWSESPSEGFFASVVLERRGSLVVEDARRDPRFRHNLLVVTGIIAFYAGFPIDSPSGQPIGVLFVFDPEPRDTQDFDESLLRECALRIQTKLWHRAYGHSEQMSA
jgi:hypothetical protein